MAIESKICAVCCKTYNKDKFMYDFVSMQDYCLVCIWKSFIYPDNSGLHFGRSLRSLLKEIKYEKRKKA